MKPTFTESSTYPSSSIISYNPAIPPILYDSDLSKSNASHPICQKTFGAIPIVSNTNICRAYNIVKSEFKKLLPSSTDILARGRLFGKAVRLVFHDAGEININTNDLLGPDGCLSDRSDNGGLLESESLVMTVIEPLWQQVCEYITRADYWVMFGMLVVEEATSNKITVSYQYGRRDNKHCSLSVGRLPSGQSGITDIERIFITQMGLTLADAGII